MENRLVDVFPEDRVLSFQVSEFHLSLNFFQNRCHSVGNLPVDVQRTNLVEMRERVGVAADVGVPASLHQILHDPHRPLAVGASRREQVQLELASYVVQGVELLQVAGEVQIALWVGYHGGESGGSDVEGCILDVVAREVVGHLDQNLSLRELQHLAGVACLESRHDHVLCADQDQQLLLDAFRDLCEEVEVAVEHAGLVVPEDFRVDVRSQRDLADPEIDHSLENLNRFLEFLHPIVHARQQMAVAVHRDRQTGQRHLLVAEEDHLVSIISRLTMFFAF